MTADDRDIAGLERRLREVRGVRERSGGVRMPNDGEFQASDDITEPERVLSRDITDVEVEILRRLGISPNATVTYEVIAKLLSREFRKETKYDSGTKELGRQMDELRQLLATPPHAAVSELQDEVAALRREVGAQRRTMKWLRGAALSAIVAALGSVGAVALKVYERAELEGEYKIRMSDVERDVDRLLRHDLSPGHSASTPAKDHEP